VPGGGENRIPSGMCRPVEKIMPQKLDVNILIATFAVIIL
jgi:hypothetical protein